MPLKHVHEKVLSSGCGASLCLHLLADIEQAAGELNDEDDGVHDNDDNNGNGDDNDNGGDIGNGKGNGNDKYLSFALGAIGFRHFLFVEF